MPWAHCAFESPSVRLPSEGFKLIFELEGVHDVGDDEARDMCADLTSSLAHDDSPVEALKMSTDSQCVVVVYLSLHWRNIDVPTDVVHGCQRCVKGVNHRIGFAIDNSPMVARLLDDDCELKRSGLHQISIGSILMFPRQLLLHCSVGAT